MKTRVVGMFWALLAMLSAAALAQPPEGRPRGDGERRPGGPPGNPVFALFDADKNGELSAEEIDGAAAILKKMDKNGDGKVSADELPRPQFGQGGPGGGRPGPGGPPGAGGGDIIARLKQLDANGDKKLTKDEVPAERQRIFEFADTNGDDTIDESELLEMAKRFRDGGGRPGAPRDGEGRPRGPRDGEGGQPKSNAKDT